MILFTAQVLVLGLVLLLFAKRSGRFDLYSCLFAVVWTIAVITIRVIYGVDHAAFYSSDQGTQLELLQKFAADGISFSLDRFIGGRYIVVAPVWLLKSFGLDPLLAFKFLQAICLLFTYKVCTDFISEQGLRIKLWHAILFCGPLFIFLSVLGLRDLEIVLCVSYFFLGKSSSLRFFALGVSALLRPHLTVALFFGWLINLWLVRHPLKRMPLAVIALTVGGFFAGGYGYAIGGLIKYKLNYKSPVIFVQQAWWRFFANIIGLQFLTFGNDIVKMTVGQLLTLRLFFIDTFLIPTLFIFTLLNRNLKHTAMRIQVYISFVFFLGLATQTSFNSSRQNLPFLSIMGVLALLGIQQRKISETTDQPTIYEIESWKN